MRTPCEPTFDKQARGTPAWLRLCALTLLCCVPAFDAAGQHHASHAAPPDARQQPARDPFMHEAKIEAPDVWVRDQDGRRLRFYTDLIKGKKVAVGFFYTTCTFICTRHGEFFSKLQSLLRGRLGKDVFLVSVTMDPRTDTPAKLTRWGQTYRRQPGWTLVTGNVEELSRVLKVFTGNTAGPRDDHSSFFYIADDAEGSWNFMDTLVEPAAVIERLDARR